jgi:putative hydrolase of the HAD superfamily
MAIKGILFDLYGTVIDIETDESLDEIYRGISKRLQLYPGAEGVLDELRPTYHMSSCF